MKRLLISGGIFVAILAFITLNTKYITSITSSAISDLIQCETYLLKDDYPSAQKYFLSAKETVLSSKKYLFATLKHDELDEVIVEFESATAYLELLDKESFLPELSSIKKRLEHINDIEKISLENIL